jgi:hypothetical protein
MHTIKVLIKCILCGIYHLNNRKYKMLRCIIWLRDNEYKARIELWILIAILWGIAIYLISEL